MAINAKVSVKTKFDTKMWDKMHKNWSKPSNYELQVGWWGTRNSEGIPVAQIAKWNEEGHANGGIFEGTYTRARPFIRINFANKMRGVKKFGKNMNLIHQVGIGSMSWKKMMEMIATDVEGFMKESILEFKTPPNKLTTISLKGFNDPLIETGLMYDSVKTRVRRIT